MAKEFLDYKIPIGLFKKTTKFIKGHVSARMWIREILKWLHVPLYDCSCTTENDFGQPVRFNSDEDQLERFTGTEWEEISPSFLGGPGVDETIVISGVGTLFFTDGKLTNFAPA